MNGSDEESAVCNRPARLPGMKGFEVGRTVSNSIELEHPKKAGKQSPEPYELRGMIEVGRT